MMTPGLKVSRYEITGMLFLLNRMAEVNFQGQTAECLAIFRGEGNYPAGKHPQGQG
jgi:hypothetical protein